MFSRFTATIFISLCIIFISQAGRADDIEMKLKQHEARLIFEAACRLVERGEYDRAIRRFDRIRIEYSETEYAELAAHERFMTMALKLERRPVTGISRASLVGFGTLFSTWLGVGSLILVDSERSEPYGFVLITVPLAGLAGCMKLTNNLKMSDGQASLIILGGYWGIWQATGAAIIADLDERAVVGASMAGGLIGIAISGNIVRHRYVSAGDATMMNFGGIWGTWFALCGAMIADLEGEDRVLTSSMIGGNVGLFSMAALSTKMEMSRARARLINISGVVGALYGLGTNILFEIDSKRDFWSVLVIGSALGLAAGTYFTQDYDAERGYFAKIVTSNAIQRHDVLIGDSGPIRTYSFSRQGRISGIDLRIPVFSIMF